MRRAACTARVLTREAGQVHDVLLGGCVPYCQPSQECGQWFNEEARVLGRGGRRCCGLHKVALQACRCAQAGGGVFFDSAAGTSSVSIVGCTISNNFVDYALAGNSHDGLGGARAPADASMALGACPHHARDAQVASSSTTTTLP